MQRERGGKRDRVRFDEKSIAVEIENRSQNTQVEFLDSHASKAIRFFFLLINEKVSRNLMVHCAHNNKGSEVLSGEGMRFGSVARNQSKTLTTWGETRPGRRHDSPLPLDFLYLLELRIIHVHLNMALSAGACLRL